MDALHRCKSDFYRLPGLRGGQSKADLSTSCPPSIGCQQLLVNVSGKGHVRLTTQSFLEHAMKIALSLEYTTTSDSNITLCPLQILLPTGFRKDDIVISSDGEIRCTIEETSSLPVDKHTRLHSVNNTRLIDTNIKSTEKETYMIAETLKICDENTDQEVKTERYTSETYTKGACISFDIDNADNEIAKNADFTDGAQNRKGHNRNSSDYMSVSNRSKVTDLCLSHIDCRKIAENNSQGFDVCDGLISFEDNSVAKADINSNRLGMEHSLNDLNRITPTSTQPQNHRSSTSSNETDTARKLSGGQAKEKTSIVANMKQSIQKGFTKLLDELDVMDLCDHLYERAVVDFKFYSTMFELHFSRRHVRDISRYLLLHLSRIGVCKDRMIDALYGSAEYRFIPVFFPEEKI
ncbi:uncharacterized protein LOC127848669 isoform X2 [Dreissena polymorpha]|uniref:Uncharacterized protein n=1 Tax=Dreissena polymorpha TaxID=45954 RepID=A0A9D4I9Y1_DREPO|nr:uncharacterized protein LOC127848669 isoform X1 [Dreissena polymorpha]XP_052237214.1 uncharacterized protein LOC127848669 isoform X1 [Dreissena polymorpha]XP_052237215.1 uncharacterized protein LOC127848669 isoform X2 [Dreissena polymorpha]KAH3755246.1 hypothetical protein DPMN_189936 [Dreissena polymorpha]